MIDKLLKYLTESGPELIRAIRDSFQFFLFILALAAPVVLALLPENARHFPAPFYAYIVMVVVLAIFVRWDHHTDVQRERGKEKEGDKKRDRFLAKMEKLEEILQNPRSDYQRCMERCLKGLTEQASNPKPE